MVVQQIGEEKSKLSKEQAIRFATLMEMVQVMCDVLNDIYSRNGSRKDKVFSGLHFNSFNTPAGKEQGIFVITF